LILNINPLKLNKDQQHEQEYQSEVVEQLKIRLIQIQRISRDIGEQDKTP